MPPTTTPSQTSAIDLFAGPGGWDVAAVDLGIDVTGIEMDFAACETRRAAGLKTVGPLNSSEEEKVRGDVTRYGPADFDVDGLIASPPCQTFSMAGNGAGRRALDDVLTGVKELAARQPLTVVHDDERTGLVLEPLRWALEAVDSGKPYRWIVLEQVPTVLPVWEAVDEVLESEGYSVLHGYVHSEQYGVPQTRKRAVLIAVLNGTAVWPKPTHSRYYSRDPKRLDEGVLPWVSMADALGWEHGLPIAVRSNCGSGGDPAARGERTADQPAAAVTSKVGRNKFFTTGTRPNAVLRQMGEPSPALAFGHDAASYTFVDSDVSIYDLPAAKADGRADRISVADAGRFQTFPADHPWRGRLGKQYEQVGNAVPPMLAKAILSAATS